VQAGIVRVAAVSTARHTKVATVGAVSTASRLRRLQHDFVLVLKRSFSPENAT